MILHIVNQSPFSHHALQQSLRALGDNDSIILIEDAVLLLSNPEYIAALPSSNQLFVLQPDCDARGISSNDKIATPVDFTQFVELVAKHTKSVSWF